MINFLKSKLDEGISREELNQIKKDLAVHFNQMDASLIESISELLNSAFEADDGKFYSFP